MSKFMEDLSHYDLKINRFPQGKAKVAGMTRGKSRGVGRKALANISNTSQGVKVSNQDCKAGPGLDALRKDIEQLEKENSFVMRENAVLMKHLADKNKLIELGGAEIQKLRVQNLQLIQSNSQMLVELNSLKEKQKLLNHELVCKNALIIAKNLELEAKDKSRICQADDSDHNKVAETEEIEVCPAAVTDDDHNKRNISNSLIHSNNTIQDDDKGKSKRLQKRRQSAKFKLDEPKPTQDNDVPPCSLPKDDSNDKMKVDDSNAATSSSSSQKEDKEADSSEDYNRPREHRKSSLSRPVREAAKKVQSYKEVNLIVKMRRE